MFLFIPIVFLGMFFGVSAVSILNIPEADLHLRLIREMHQCPDLDQEQRTKLEWLERNVNVVYYENTSLDAKCGKAYLFGTTIYLNRALVHKPECGYIDTFKHEVLHLLGFDHSNEVEQYRFDKVLDNCHKEAK